MADAFYPWLLAVACALLITNVLYYSVIEKNHITNIRNVVRDFRDHRYYRPWAPEPIMIPATKKIMTELSETSVLSQRAVYSDLFGFKHTLNGADHNEVNTRKSRLLSRVLQVRGPTQFEELYPYLLHHLKTIVDAKISSGGTTSIRLALFSETILSRLMGAWFFGGNMTSDPRLRDALLNHPRQIKACSAAFQLTPRFIAPLVHAMITWRGSAMHLIQDRLIDVITAGIDILDEKPEIKKVWANILELYCSMGSTPTNDRGPQLTLLYHMVDLSTADRSYWTPERLSQSLLGLWLAASHQPWVNLHAILVELCLRPEWQDALRDEALQSQDDLASKINELPLLDSFVRETARVNSLDKIAIRRKALTDYSFSSVPLSIPAGSILCVSSYDATRNEHIYPDPEKFDGKRFINGRCKDTSNKFADVSENHLIWGYGSLACPGRHHAAFMIKIIVVHIVTNYSLRLADPEAPRWWTWEDFRMPFASTRVLFSKRATEDDGRS
ncbi:cytochrome P450 [Aspergillus eucalypticola CBS 122712]|uniref:Cytochrome P450 n=1 Tax=Aspergillus eucalypticola (strain CBS 122712 / IBT 29274) TaxID=1448314 RepID=A0A317VR60_ASPEC|nr:cytochrome P450 [Aspergillus eucalypticola CBS 122712]PWY75771.1 cytochrome P450 [Aspergillus eucalypticola CBS 122712]